MRSIPQSLFDSCLSVPPPRLPLVVDRHTFKDTADIGIVEGALLCPASVLFGELALLSATLITQFRATPVANASVETNGNVPGSNPLHRLADLEAWPSTALFGRRLGQKLTDHLITDFAAAVFSAEPAYFRDPTQQRFGVDFTVFPATWNAPDSTEKLIGCGSQPSTAPAVFQSAIQEDLGHRHYV